MKHCNLCHKSVTELFDIPGWTTQACILCQAKLKEACDRGWKAAAAELKWQRAETEAMKKPGYFLPESWVIQ